MVALCPKDVALVSYKSIFIVYIIKYIIWGNCFPHVCEHYVHKTKNKKNFSFFYFAVHLLLIVVEFSHSSFGIVSLKFSAPRKICFVGINCLDKMLFIVRFKRQLNSVCYFIYLQLLLVS